MSYTIYIPNTMLNVTGIFIFSTIMLFYFSGNDMVKIQEKTIDDAINDFRLILGFTNFNFTEEMKTDILKKLKINKKNENEKKNIDLLINALMIILLLIILTIISFKIFGKDFNISVIMFNILLITSLLITEVYIYFEIIRLYKYKTKEIFYDRLFLLLLQGENHIELKKNICKTNIDEENIIFY